MALITASIWSPEHRADEPEMGARETSPGASRGETSSPSEGDTGHRGGSLLVDASSGLCGAAQPQRGTSQEDYYSLQDSL